MKTTRILSTILVLVSSVLALRSPSSASAAWQQVWSDEFNGTAIDTSNWGYEIGFIRNSELQYYTSRPENARIESGNLVIECRRESYNGAQYTSASLNTQGKRSFRYGRIEMRAKLPYSKGLWPAFWTLGVNISTVGWPACGEIDIMEMIGGGEGFDDKTYGTIHYDNGGHQGNGSSYQLPTGIFADAYHIFAVEWDSTNIKWFMDGVNFHTVNISNQSIYSELHQSQYLLLNLAIGGSWPNSVGKTPDASTVLPQKYYIDYVRVYNWVADSSNLALGKPVTVSSTESASVPGSAAVDGNTGTRWSSAYSDPQWIYVDLGATYNISRIRLNWEAAYARSYQLQVSPNASTWTTIYSTTTGDGGIDDRTGLSGSGRYVRMYGTQRATVYGYSLWEFEVFGTSASGPVPDGTYKLIARHSGKCADVQGLGTTNGSNVHQWSYGGGNNQKWTITHLGSSQYKIIGVQSGRCLDVAAQSTADGANIQIWDYLGQSNQKWTVAATSGGYYRLTAVHSGKVLDVSGVSTADGANIHQWTWVGGNNQQWAFQAP
jgi:beta-glucanase (GH16 family)